MVSKCLYFWLASPFSFSEDNSPVRHCCLCLAPNIIQDYSTSMSFQDWIPVSLAHFSRVSTPELSSTSYTTNEGKFSLITKPTLPAAFSPLSQSNSYTCNCLYVFHAYTFIYTCICKRAITHALMPMHTDFSIVNKNKHLFFFT
jgi:hypothetical protein